METHLFYTFHSEQKNLLGFYRGFEIVLETHVSLKEHIFFGFFPGTFRQNYV